MSATAATVTASRRPVRVLVAGRELLTWTTVEAGRDLADIAGAFRIEYTDVLRDSDAGFQSASSDAIPVHEHMAVQIYIHGALVLNGYIDDLDLVCQDGQARCTASGRDRAGDLVDCAANPVGPGEYRQVQLLDVVGSLVKPYGLSIDSDTDTGAPFTLVAVDEGEPVMSAIEKLSRQRGVLIVSDGVGGLRLTKAGQQRAAGDIIFPTRGTSLETRVSVREHYSDVWVKGQFPSQLRPAQATLSASSAPADRPVSASGAQSFTQQEMNASARYGHAVDPSVGRWRPRLWLAKTQSGGSKATQNAGNPPLDADAAGFLRSQGLNPAAYHAAPAATGRSKKRAASKPRSDTDPWTLQDQAEWRMRSTKAHGTARVYTVAGYAVNDELWRPNTVVRVRDSYSGIDGDRLIGAVTYVADASGYRTRISVVSLDAYNIEGEPSTAARR
ncbi:phage baseplate assembly protein [Acetobacter fallax]|uniref:Phage tail protein n=1 Tax=Acetobacter fallax TaxID=1737473 RepID=A0ABX0KAB1_9PROT|nr:hypothetical protein [Acetobacter fallax]NHO33334.1 hypothetical protein [Acetobacter fallax]NHO36955.1 hypothetical protein [Acetobacter fallax]